MTEPNEVATEVLLHLRKRAHDPMQGTLICMMVMYHIWSQSEIPFEEWHNYVSATLCQLHLDNIPKGTLQ